MHYSYYIQALTSQLQRFIKMMPMREMFATATRMPSCGIEGYHVQNKYVGYTDQEKSKIKKPDLKRGSYLDDYNKVHGSIPGPGVYNYAKNLWPEKSTKPKVKFFDKKTFIDQIMRQCKKEKRPAPGQYKLQKTLKQLQKQRVEFSRRKTHHADRITYLDGIQYQATQTPGVGKYNTRSRPKSSSTAYRKQKPEDWRKKHEQQNKKKKPKVPDMGSYNPREAQSYTRKSTKQGQWSREQRFSASKSGSGLGPGKYIPIDDWTHKNQVVQKSRPRSAYYN